MRRCRGLSYVLNLSHAELDNSCPEQWADRRVSLFTIGPKSGVSIHPFSRFLSLYLAKTVRCGEARKPQLTHTAGIQSHEDVPGRRLQTRATCGIERQALFSTPSASPDGLILSRSGLCQMKRWVFNVKQ